MIKILANLYEMHLRSHQKLVTQKKLYSNYFSHLNVIVITLGDNKFINYSNITLKVVFSKFGLSIKNNFTRLSSHSAAFKLQTSKDNFNSLQEIQNSMYQTGKVINSSFTSTEQAGSNSVYHLVIFLKQINLLVRIF